MSKMNINFFIKTKTLNKTDNVLVEDFSLDNSKNIVFFNLINIYNHSNFNYQKILIST